MKEVHDMTYYKKCMLGGIISCGSTHTLVCPLDIIKCRMQVSFTNILNILQANPGMYSGVKDGFFKIKTLDGFKGFTVGWLPTLIGYSAQGFGKFGFYEIFKDFYQKSAGKHEAKYRTLGFAASSACAEAVADVLLCPWEAVSKNLFISINVLKS